MEHVDVWFCRYDDELYCGIADYDEPPKKVVKVRSSDTAAMVLRRAKNSGKYEIMQVGICSPEMLGLE